MPNGTSKAPPRLVIPSMAWLALFLVGPLVLVAGYAFSIKGTYGGIEPGWTLENLARVFDPLYLRIFWRSLQLAALTTVGCLLVGYPVAYVMATLKTDFARKLLLLLIMIPFWTNFVVRAFSIRLLLGETGPVSAALLALGLTDGPVSLTNSTWAVAFGMITNYLPFMVLPLFVALEKFDFTMLEAARDLGAGRRARIFRVLLPMTRAGAIAGCVFVFAPALGEFIIPDLLGGAKTLMMGGLISEQFLKSRDWPFGSALSLLLALAVIPCMALYLKMQKPENEGGVR